MWYLPRKADGCLCLRSLEVKRAPYGKRGSYGDKVDLKSICIERVSLMKVLDAIKEYKVVCIIRKVRTEQIRKQRDYAAGGNPFVRSNFGPVFRGRIKKVFGKSVY